MHVAVVIMIGELGCDWHAETRQVMEADVLWAEGQGCSIGVHKQRVYLPGERIRSRRQRCTCSCPACWL